MRGPSARASALARAHGPRRAGKIGAHLGLYGGIDLIRDPYTQAQSGQLVLTGLVTADFTVPRGMQTRILTGIGAP